MHTNVTKWGNSLGIRIPHAYVEQIGIVDGSQVDLVVENNKIVISKMSYSLKDLLKKVNAKNLHREIDSGEARGNEAW